jgi:voltage-gated potassium channel
MYFAEYRTHPTGFQSIPDSMYWALITLTTVGYGDITPITVAGKLIAVGSAILGVIVVALVTGIVASSFNSQMERRNIIFEDQVRKALLDGILDHTEKADLERLRKEFGMTKRRADALINQVQSMRAKK